MIEKTFKIDNFIGVYDGYITEKECKKAIKIFEDQTNFNTTINRQTFEKASVLNKQDQQFFANSNNIKVWHSELKSLIVNFDMAFKHYSEATGVMHAFDTNDFLYTSLKIQKTLPTEGYHVWHIDDVEDGGETEFLHFSKRVKPKTGRIVIWPASFPYVHRGNPPLSGEKYILTSWLMLR